MIVQLGYAHPDNLPAIDAWICTLAFAFQIYYDFSGYTDIGRGSAMLLGFKLPENFNKPYLAPALIEFWRRWHMSLSTWLRDYLFKPLGGSHNGMLQKNRNLLITMLLGGLWHGASWHYLLWGAFHGIGLIVNHFWRQFRFKTSTEAGSSAGYISLFFSTLITFLFVIMGWVLFRANNATEALAIYRSMFNWHSCGSTASPCLQMIYTSAIPAGLCLYGCLQLIKYTLTRKHGWLIGLSQYKEHRILSWQWWLFPPSVIQIVGYLSCVILTLGLSARTTNPFIYFQF